MPVLNIPEIVLTSYKTTIHSTFLCIFLTLHYNYGGDISIRTYDEFLEKPLPGIIIIKRVGSQIFQKSFGRLIHILKNTILHYSVSYKVTAVYANYVNTRNTSSKGNGLKRLLIYRFFFVTYH